MSGLSCDVRLSLPSPFEKFEYLAALLPGEQFGVRYPQPEYPAPHFIILGGCRVYFFRSEVRASRTCETIPRGSND
jgi:hypothetical protein